MNIYIVTAHFDRSGLVKQWEAEAPTAACALIIVVDSYDWWSVVKCNGQPDKVCIEVAEVITVEVGD
jgi:hypothetical protein